MKKNNNGEKKTSYILTRETFGMTILLFCLVVTVMLLTHNLVFGAMGSAVCTFMYGTFGYASYFVVALLAYLGQWLVFEKKVRLNWRCALCVTGALCMAFLLFQSVTTAKFDMSGYGKYLAQCYNNASAGYGGYTFGGVIFGLLAYPVAKFTTFIGAYVIFSVLTIGMIALSFFVIRNRIRDNKVAMTTTEASKKEKKVKKGAEEDLTVSGPDNLYQVNENHEIVSGLGRGGQTVRAVQDNNDAQQNAAADNKYSRENLGRKILFQPGEFAAESYRRNMIYNEDSYFNHPVRNDDDYIKNFSEGQKNGNGSATPPPTSTYTSDYSAQAENNTESEDTPSYLYGSNTDEAANEGNNGENSDYSSFTVNSDSSVDFEENDEDIYTLDEQPSMPSAQEIRQIEDEEQEEDSLPVVREEPPAPPARQEEAPRERNANDIFNLFSASNPRLSENRRIEPDASKLSSARKESRENLFDDDKGDGDNLFAGNRTLMPRATREQPEPPSVSESGRRAEKQFTETRQPREIPDETPKAIEEPPKHLWKKYVRPSLDLLDDYPENNNVNTGEIEESKQIICETLAGFRIDSRISDVVVGPAITRYDVIIEDRTNIKNALKYREAIAMSLMKENVTAYLNYSKGAISIEVPNSKRSVVGLKTMLASSQFLNAKPTSLTFTLGKNVEGKCVCPDITKMPHLLVAGTTGSGKSICLSTLIVSLLYKYGPEDLRFVLVDPKQVEFISYDKLPHLMINEIIYDVDKTIKALNWAIKEMERRYALFKEMTENGVATKNLDEYNNHMENKVDRLPKIVIILDEFGDLMMQAKKDIESRIIRLVQKARACGIHLILATQRPSVDCITGLIKSNLPTRIGFKVNSFDDARCIFDIGGAEKLLGKGDLYFRSADSPDLARIQGCFIDTHEVQKVTDFIKQNNETFFDQSVSDFINTVEEEPAATVGGDDGASAEASKVDDTFIKALKFCVTSNAASVSMIQRRFPIGYMKACKIIDWMENMNYITQSEGSKPRKVLLSREEFVQKYGDVDD